MAELTNGTGTAASPLARDRAHARRLLACVAASIGAHLMLLVTAPEFLRGALPEPARPLEVSLRAPDPMPVAHEVPKPAQPRREPTSNITRPMTTVPLSAAPATPVFAAPEPRIQAAASDAPDERRGATEAPVDATPRESTPIVPPNFQAAYLKNPPPRYPTAARRNGDQGTVMLKVLVTREGDAADVLVERSSGSAVLDGAARESVKSWRFVPARKGQQPVDAWVLVPIVFKLEGAT